MSTVVIDGPTRDKLLAAGGPVELTDEAGNLIGRFVRAIRIGQYVIEDDWPTKEEIERRIREEKRYTAAQVAERLRAIGDARR